MSPTFVLSVALAVGAPALKEKAAPSLVGEWEAESQTSAGRPRAVPATGPVRYVFQADGTWVTYRGERKALTLSRAYSTDPKADPPTIDLKYEPAEQTGRVVPGIYKVEGDRLTLCLARRDGPRPTGFESSAEVPTTVYVFRRVKPGD